MAGFSAGMMTPDGFKVMTWLPGKEWTSGATVEAGRRVRGTPGVPCERCSSPELVSTGGLKGVSSLEPCCDSGTENLLCDWWGVRRRTSHLGFEVWG